jgi:nucleotide-binding universal stress UspA family protein
VLPDEFESGPRHTNCLFADILVAINGQAAGWHALDHAVHMLRCDQSRLHGLHIVRTVTDKTSEGTLAVVTAIESGRVTAETLAHAQSYLKAQGVPAEYIKAGGPVAEAILSATDQHQASLILTGSYGFTPVLEVVLGSAVDLVLHTSHRAVLICR